VLAELAKRAISLFQVDPEGSLSDFATSAMTIRSNSGSTNICRKLIFKIPAIHPNGPATSAGIVSALTLNLVIGSFKYFEFHECEPLRMANKSFWLRSRKKIALVAHDNKKQDLLEWVRFNKPMLAQHELFATGTTGTLLEHELGLTLTKLESGPLGGDQQVGAKIAEGTIDFLIFFWDPLEPLSHDPDIKALLRIAAVWNIPVACDRSSADFMISSPLMSSEYERLIPNYNEYRERLKQTVLQ
jgi:methylglyoxal synthase